MNELTLASDEIEVVILPDVGGRIHRLRAFGVDLIRTPPDARTHLREPFYWGAYPMLPWCGRVATSPSEVGGRTIHLPQNHPDGWAIHGQAYVAPWQQVDERTLRLNGGAGGWPWKYAAEMAFDLGPSLLRVDLALTNLDDAPMPAGVGLHPWFRTPVLVRVPADCAYDDNERSSALATAVAGSYDLRRPTELAVGVDSTWTGLREHRVDLTWPAYGLRGVIAAETSGNLVVVAARLPSIPDAIAVEPQTHAPQGLRRLVNGEPDAIAMLAPGEALRLSVNLRVDR